MVGPVSMHSRGSVGIVRSSKGCSIARDRAIVCDRVIAYDRIFVFVLCGTMAVMATQN